MKDREGINIVSYNQDTKYFDKVANQKVKCKHCGHVIIFLNRIPKIVCNYCGWNVYINDREEFKDRVKSKIKRGRN